MTTPALFLALPCSTCGAKAGAPCVRQNGEPTSRPHSGRTPLAPCGSFGGYQRHKKSGEESCEPCREANRRYMQEYRKRRPEARDRDVALLRARHRARHRAVTRLVELHRDDFDRILADEKGAA